MILGRIAMAVEFANAAILNGVPDVSQDLAAALGALGVPLPGDFPVSA